MRWQRLIPVVFLSGVYSFHSSPRQLPIAEWQPKPLPTTSIARAEKSKENDSLQADTASARPPCFYRSPSKRGKWTSRLELTDLRVGQELPDAVLVQELLNGKTGPKLFVECGVGRCRGRRWKIQTAMVRLNTNKNSGKQKMSVAAKRAARLRQRDFFSVYVARIRLDSDQLDVCLKPEQVEYYQASDYDSTTKGRISVSALSIGQECVGTVQRVENYGVLVDVGANRMGLLHIKRVAELYGRYIDTIPGLIEAGLERGARIKVQVLANQQKRLFFDFTNDVKEIAREEMEEQQKQQHTKRRSGYIPADSSWAPSTLLMERPGISAESVASSATMNQADKPYAEQAVAWEGFSSDDAGSDDDDDYDDYDEDRDIEDSLGLGTY
jgi:predicted RNA-binding protein with RPS1 domain